METITVFNQNILISVDDSQNSRRSVIYVARMLKGLPDVHVTVLHIIPEPDDDFFPSPEQKTQWIEQYEQKVNLMMENYRDMMVRHGMALEKLTLVSKRMYCPSIAECILKERRAIGAGTIVIGRRGLSRSEEFLFGSTSSKIVNHARDCAVWVIS
jgi:nucleotide-binding universal stress UspA family protein